MRTKIRNYLLKFNEDGLNLNKIKLTLNNLQSANQSLNFYKEKSVKKHLRYLYNNTCMVSYDLFIEESDDLSSLSNPFSIVGTNHKVLIA